MDRGENKAYLPLAGVPLLAWSVRTFAASPRIAEIVVVAREEEHGMAAALLPPVPVRLRVIAGGEERADSARAGVDAADGDVVLVHDAARPFASTALIDRVLDGVERYGACIPVMPEVDTLRRVDAGGRVLPDPIERRGLVRVQTPQGFAADVLRRALTASVPGPWLTDDAALVLAAGGVVATTPGEVWNVKITSPADLDFAEEWARLRKDALEACARASVVLVREQG